MRKSRVIIIDDDADVRDGLGAWLAPTYEVVCFDGAETFLASISDVRAQDAQSTCLLLDFQMPGMNGVDLQGRIKLLNLEYPIIFMSGNALQSDVIDAWRGGAIDFVLNPHSPSKSLILLSGSQYFRYKSWC